MPTSVYLLKNGKRVPSVTTIISRFKSSDALIGWAMRRTRELDLEALRGVPDKIFDLKNASLAITTAPTARDQARGEADAGTICHQWIDDTAHKKPLTRFDITDEQRRLATNGLAAFNEWWEQNDFKVVATEQALVSETYRYGGTLDMLATDRRGNLCMLDWKCANAIYPEQYVPQIAAYSQLARESDLGVVSKAHLFRAGKQDASGHHHQWSDETMALGWDYFQLLREAYDKGKRLAKL